MATLFTSRRVSRPRAAAPTGRLATTQRALPPWSFLLVGMITVQFGAALAKDLFPQLGPAGVVLLRVGVAALVLLVLSRPWRLVYPRAPQTASRESSEDGWVLPRRYTRADFAAVALFGLTLAAMNFSFYGALDRIPLGVAVTVEFVGPLGVAVAGSRRPLDLLWVLLAVAGILLLAPLGILSTQQLDPLGLALALFAGACWGTYILLSARVGRTFPGRTGLALAMTVGGLALLPIGVLGAGRALLDPWLLLLGVCVALLSSVVPYSLELAALRRMSTGSFGVFMSLEPAIAALVGVVALREQLEPRAVLALALVTLASLGATRRPGRFTPDTLE